MTGKNRAMDPNFALALSFEGIALLRRVGDTWAQIDDVALDAADLEVAVIGLRDQALALEPGGDKVALVLPNEQIRYLSVDDPGGADSRRDGAILEALDGATPYDVSDLVFDHAQDNGKLNIAAVAEETLEEAEAFALQHGFKPISFLARAPEGFDLPVFFGPANSWSGEVARPIAPMHVLTANKAAHEPAIDVPDLDDTHDDVVPQASVTPDIAESAIADDAFDAPATKADTVEAVDDTADMPLFEAAADRAIPAADDVVKAVSQDVPEVSHGEGADVAPHLDTSKQADLLAPIGDQSWADPVVSDNANVAKPSEDSADALEQSVFDSFEPEGSKPLFPADGRIFDAAAEAAERARDAKDKDPVADVVSGPDDDAPAVLKDVAADAVPPLDAPALTKDIEMPPVFAPRESVSPPVAAPPKPVAPEPMFQAPKPDPDPVAKAPVAMAEPVFSRSFKPDPAPVPTPDADVPTAPDPTADPAPVAFSTVRAARDLTDLPPAPKPLVLDEDSPKESGFTPRFTPSATKGTVVREAGITSKSVIDPVVDEPAKPVARADAKPPLVAKPAAADPMNNLARRDTVTPPDGASGFAAPVADGLVKKPLLAKALAKKSARSKSPEVARPAAAPPLAARRAEPAPAASDTASPAENPLSRLAALRKNKGQSASASVAGGAMTADAAGASFAPKSERERMTVFGARSKERVGGKPRFLGLLLTTALLLFLAGVAAWATVFLDDGLARLFQRDDTRAIAELPDINAEPIAASAAALNAPAALRNAPAAADGANGELRLAALESTDGAVTDVPLALTPIIAPHALTPEEAAATYATSGIWQRAPVGPMLPPSDVVENVYVASIDPSIRQFDAVALPDPLKMSQEPGLTDPGLPPPFGLTFDFDDRGLIRATPEGALSPDGVRIFAGLPPVVPPARPKPDQLNPEISTDPAVNPLGKLRPKTRPGDLVEQRERATLQGRSLDELAKIRPAMRPKTVQEQAVAEDPTSPATDRAVSASLVPVGRPRNMTAIVKNAEKIAKEKPAEAVQVAAVAPRTVQPKIPTGASVSRSATVKNAINLRKINLIGVFGTPSNRRALVRLANGKYQKVKVGDRLNGGRVKAIGESDLSYVKSGKNVTLKMPRS